MWCPLCKRVGGYAIDFETRAELLHHLQRVHGLLPYEAEIELLELGEQEEDYEWDAA